MPIIAGTRVDPLRGYKYRVSVPGFTVFGFSKVSGLKEETEKVEYREGTDPSTPYKLPGLVGYDDIVLEHGLSTNRDIVRWRQRVIDRTKGGYNVSDGEKDFREIMIITLYNREGEVAKEWKALEAWPCALEIGDLDASSSDVLIESCTIAHEGLVRTDKG